MATRKLRIPAEAAQRKVELLSQLTVVIIDVVQVLEAIKLHRLYSLSFWDALVLQSARTAGCVELLTEDLQSGQRIEGVEVVNPFTA